ncbi:Uncharacterised protein [Mycobacteroides abscessus subsp. abscessus]|uniref:hypothetical protein n=1 Tax=Mycobacteroides abscessus TaxID=36809 RepID=UPI000928E49E|nr:hypothetical protein [Mycobacteroides abscessus]SIC59624.1 Uncharacterised protein [Mycobacteroides abscessus subsp. abscessus]SIC91407.1 Uncharacterised protein [Mycobacteroides abscessus subsp. abscessus]SID11297.1 Uncharacterised protein [Mycobacteroides abscessus subsp. abscessus]SID17791.1 Uncharacterised protein [Mycobacteroides abscessus subsp. abscessus]SKT52586.1 Uncharacterised protein [Mycobacteroides abscessus subsp. abscessus]
MTNDEPHVLGLGNAAVGKRDVLDLVEMAQAASGDAAATRQAFKRAAFEVEDPKRRQ